MQYEYATTVLDAVCPDCGERLDAIVGSVELDWTDDRERTLGQNAVAVQMHRVDAHPVTPQVGDVVVYYAAWRGMILGTGPLIVRSIHERDLHEFARSMGNTDLSVAMGTMYRLVNPARESDYYLPSTGDEGRPITFEIITAYRAPAVEATLFDLLGGEWAEAAA